MRDEAGGRAKEPAERDPGPGWLRSRFARLPYPRPGVAPCGRPRCPVCEGGGTMTTQRARDPIKLEVVTVDDAFKFGCAMAEWVKALKTDPPMRRLACEHEWWWVRGGDMAAAFVVVTQEATTPAGIVVGLCIDCLADPERVKASVRRLARELLPDHDVIQDTICEGEEEERG